MDPRAVQKLTEHNRQSPGTLLTGALLYPIFGRISLSTATFNNCGTG